MVSFSLIVAIGAQNIYVLKKGLQKEHTLLIATICFLLDSILTITLAISLLNPLVYLDTMLLIGSIGGRVEGFEQYTFTFGAISASFVWFFSLAYGSRILIPLFKKILHGKS